MPTPSSAPLLLTKITPPPPRRELLPRTRLLALLTLGLEHPVTLISTGAGFGKSTLVSQWLTERMKDEGGRMKPGSDPSTSASSFIPHPSSFAWLALDAGDNDPVRFWRYVLGAIERALPGLDAEFGALFHGPGPGATEVIVASLLNHLQLAAQPLVLILDDYHVIEQSEIHRGLTYAIDHLPASARVVLVSRADPPLPLSRWRARGQLAELRAAQLRFRPEETQAFLADLMGLALAPEQIDVLEARTEGWAVGLQLAALSLHGQADPGAFIAQFAASHRTALDYLIDEVVAQQPAEVQHFLLHTAILDRMCAELCDAVVKEEGGTVKDEDRATGSDPAQPFILHPSSFILAQLERANLFLIPLDAEGAWYRYHHLFRSALRQRLQRQTPAQIPALHRRAAGWLVGAGLSAEAIEHACAAGDTAHMAELVETATIPTWLRGEITTLQRWLDDLPGALYATRPSLLLWRAWSALMVTNWPLLEQTVAQVEQVLAGSLSGDSPHWGELLALKGWLARLAGEPDRGYALSTQALTLLRPDDAFRRSLVGSSAAQAAWALGDSAAARACAEEAITQGERADNGSLTAYAHALAAWVLIDEGQLGQAGTYASTALALTSARGLAQLPMNAFCHVVLAEVALLRDHLAEAQRHAEAALALLSTGAFKDALMQTLHMRIGTARARGDRATAEAELARMEHELATTGLPGLALIGHAQRAWLALLEGRLSEADALLAAAPQRGTVGVGIEGGARTARALLRVLQGRAAEALELLEPGMRVAHLHGVAAALLVAPLRALALAAQGQSDCADQVLAEALTRAAPEGLVRPFLDLGPYLAPSLRRLHQTLPDTHPARPLAGMVLARLGAAPATETTPAEPQRQPSALSP